LRPKTFPEFSPARIQAGKNPINEIPDQIDFELNDSERNDFDQNDFGSKRGKK
jgi:hypothetical protein